MTLHDTATWREIQQQPALWDAWARGPALADARAWLAALAPQEVWLCGAGTSAFIGDIIAAGLEGAGGPRLRAIPTTDLVSRPRAFLPTGALVLHFGRSGDSAEIAGPPRRARRALPRHAAPPRHLQPPRRRSPPAPRPGRSTSSSARGRPRRGLRHDLQLHDHAADRAGAPDPRGRRAHPRARRPPARPPPPLRRRGAGRPHARAPGLPRRRPPGLRRPRIRPQGHGAHRRRASPASGTPPWASATAPRASSGARPTSSSTSPPTPTPPSTTATSRPSCARSSPARA